MDGSCAICWDSDDFRVLKCGHCFCVECLSTLRSLRCFECDENHDTIKCPMDRSEDPTPVDSLPTPANFTGKLIPLTIPERNSIKDMQDITEIINDLIRLRKLTISHLRNVVTKLDTHEFNCAAAKIGGSSAGMTGAILSIVGISLTLTGFGSAVGAPLSITGICIAISGALTTSGAAVTDTILKNIELKSINEDLKMDYFRSQQVNVLICRASKDASLSNKWKAHNFVELGGIIMNLAKIGVSIGGGAMKLGANTATRIAPMASGQAIYASTNASTYASAVTDAVACSLNIASITFASLTLPLDIWIIVTNSIRVHKKKPSKVIRDIRNIANNLEKDLNKYMKMKK